MAETKRDRVKDILRASLKSAVREYEEDEVYEWACDTADGIFDTLGISPNEQDRP
jgi:hypothetical protein